MSQATTTAGPSITPRDATGTIVRARPRLRLLRPLLMLGGIVAVAVVALLYWLDTGRWVSTDDAYVQADRVALSTDVSGLVQSIDVKTGEVVKRGQVLFRLDPRQFQIALDDAKANLAQQALDLNAAKSEYARMLRDVAVRAAMVQSDQADFKRYAALVRGVGVTRQEYD
ncbi:MAG: HlyD family secretion protein, partial [Acetobacteraceae bacterium]